MKEKEYDVPTELPNINFDELKKEINNKILMNRAVDEIELIVQQTKLSLNESETDNFMQRLIYLMRDLR